MNLKDLMNADVDVGEVYTKVADMIAIMEVIEKEEKKISLIETDIRKLLESVPTDSTGIHRIDMMNGTVLVIEEEVMYMEVSE